MLMMDNYCNVGYVLLGWKESRGYTGMVVVVVQ
jgi:hypothetical protein